MDEASKPDFSTSREQLVQADLEAKVTLAGSTAVSTGVAPVAILHTPDQTALSVALRSRQEDSYRLAEQIADGYQEARALAEIGNGEAAYALHSALYNCSILSYGSEDEMEQAINTLYQTRTQPTGGSAKNVSHNDADVFEVAAHMRDTFHQCKGLSTQQKEEAHDWLTVAADNGHIYAMYQLGLNTASTARSREYLQKAWEAGEVEALPWLAARYAEVPGGQPDQQNLMAAYSYLYLYELLSNTYAEAAGRLDTQRYNELIAGVTEKRKVYANALTPHEETVATERIGALLQQNQNCCFPSALVLASTSSSD